MLVAACGAPQVPRARLAVGEPASERELDAAERVRGRRCSGGIRLLAPGLGPLCHGKHVEGFTLMTLFTAEAVTAFSVARSEGFDHPGAALPLVALQDIYVYSVIDPIIDEQLARQAPFAPQDTLGELVWAPVNPNVMKRTDVWAGILGMTALGLGVSLLVDEDVGDGWGDDANLFGTQFAPVVGYPLAGAAFGGLFLHVAIAEEALFRGALQSGLARRWGETRGWLGGSLAFGATHSLNALALPEDQRRDYLLIGVPFITVVGSYLGLSYRWNDYSLAPPVAIHFWYDFLLSAAFFAMDPQGSPLSAMITVPW